MDLTPFKECRAHKNAIYIGNDDAPFRPCCWFADKIDATSYEEYQDKLSHLDIEKNCRYCIEMESNGGEWSHRMNFAKALEDLDWYQELVVSISFDNLCNLKCITCSPVNSSQLAIEILNPEIREKYTSIHKKEPIKTEFLKNMLSNTEFNYNTEFSYKTITEGNANYSNLRIEILGGEPLINPAVYNFLDWLVEQPYASVTAVSITTNGTIFNDKFIKYIKHLHHISLQFSIDGIEDTFEYIRFGSKFSTLEEVTNKFYDLLALYPEKFKMAMHYTLSWMNSLHIKEFFNWVNVNYPEVQYILVTKLEWPNNYDINVLPMDLRKQIVEEISNSIVGYNDGVQLGFKYYKQHMLNTPNNTKVSYNVQRGMNALAKNDKLINRNSDFNKTFKPMLDLLKTNNII